MKTNTIDTKSESFLLNSSKSKKLLSQIPDQDYKIMLCVELDPSCVDFDTGEIKEFRKKDNFVTVKYWFKTSG